MAKIIQFPEIYQEYKEEIKSKFKKGDKIYYHGDMANYEGWFEIVSLENNEFMGCIQYDLKEIEGTRTMTIEEYQIKEEYEGHGGTRIVTERAYKEFEERQTDKMMKHWAKYMD